METDTDTAAVESAAWPLRVRHAHDDDVADIVALNNMFAPDGLTLYRSEAFVVSHLQDYQVVRGADGTLMGQVALDEYSPSLVELVSLAVATEAQGDGLGQRLITAAEKLARERGYPEKIARYRAISRSELSIGRKFCFAKKLTSVPAAG